MVLAHLAKAAVPLRKPVSAQLRLALKPSRAARPRLRSAGRGRAGMAGSAWNIRMNLRSMRSFTPHSQAPPPRRPGSAARPPP